MRKHILSKRPRFKKPLTEEQKKVAVLMLAVRQKLGISQTAMANLLGVSLSAYAHWENASVRCPWPKMFELALRYLMNTYVVARPLDVVIEDGSDKEKKNEVKPLKPKYGTRKPKAGTKRKGSDSAE